MSWAPEVQTDDSGNWYGNQLRFATEQEAIDWAHGLKGRWSLVDAYRAVESDDPVNYSYHERQLRPIGEPS